MFILFGYKLFQKKFGEKSEWCLACKNSKVAYVRTSYWFTLFFIPLFPYMFKYSKVCTVCGYATNIKRKEFFEELKTQDVLPPSPFEENQNQVDAELDGAREITINRKKQFYGGMMAIKCFVDGSEVAIIKNGQTVKFEVNSTARSMFVMMSGFGEEIRSNIVDLKSNTTNNVYNIKMKGQKIELSNMPL